MVAWIANFMKVLVTTIKINKYSINMINISTKISQKLLLLSILYFFQNADLLEIYLFFGLQIIARSFIENTILFATRFYIVENYKKFKKLYQLYIIWAIKHVSKIDLFKYQLVHLL